VLTFVIKESKKTYHTYTELLQVDYSLPRHERAHNLAQQYASRIEQMALEHPYQWFNFFDFWA
ncbi:MAG: acyltransferase, partial [Paludibacteraceae bacterium]|nr:acyltransferase [Paludibacteraceae bacterium]